MQGHPVAHAPYEALEGRISSFGADAKGRVRGSSGSIPGYDGGPVFSYEKKLLGMNVGVESLPFMTTNRRTLPNESMNEAPITFSSLSIIVPIYHIVAKYYGSPDLE